MTISLKEAWCKVAEWCETPPWSTSDLDEQTLAVDCPAGELTISNGNSVPLSQLGTRTVYRYTPPVEPGLRARWWAPAAGPHLDPALWTGPGDFNGHPLPAAVAPDVDIVNNSTNINDSNSGAGQARYGIVSGWVFLPDGVTDWRDNNGNTGELGMVLSAPCCSGNLSERPGGNHTANTGGADRTLMDANPVTAGWHQVYSPQSDASAFGGLDLEYSLDGGASWINVTVQQPDRPTVETDQILNCLVTPEGWTDTPLAECCDAVFAPAGEAAPIAATVLPVADNEADAAIRTGQVGTSLDYARADHNHPIVRQSNPGDPTITEGGNITITQALILDRWSTEETFSYRFRVRISQPAGNGWGWLNVPTIAGFQQPKIGAIGTYRNPSTEIQNDDGTFGAAPRGPYMGAEAHHWSSTNRVYSGFFRRDDAITSSFFEFTVDYLRT